MSLVTIAATQEFLIAMSDGRITYSDEKESRIVHEDYFKIIPVCRDYFVAFTGDLAAIEAFNQASGILKPESDIKEFAAKIHGKLMDFTYGEVFVNYAIGGRNSKNEIEFFIFSSFSDTIDHNKPDSMNNFKFKALVSENLDIETIGEEISNILDGMESYTPENIIKAQEEITRLVAEVDSTVNTNTFHIIINKS